MSVPDSLWDDLYSAETRMRTNRDMHRFFDLGLETARLRAEIEKAGRSTLPEPGEYTGLNEKEWKWITVGDKLSPQFHAALEAEMKRMGVTPSAEKKNDTFWPETASPVTGL